MLAGGTRLCLAAQPPHLHPVDRLAVRGNVEPRCNRLAHAYSVVDDGVTWGLLSGPLDKLIADMEAI